eukprot:SAG11_NODE_6370_length_1327_cov_4.947883_1_plen_87_part_00
MLSMIDATTLFDFMSSIINATTLFDFMLSMINATTLFCTGIQKIPKLTMGHFHTDENTIGLKTNCIETATGKWLIIHALFLQKSVF